ncbi:hypothetical protein EAHG_04592 [Escherichia coli B671]|nr:hypothetical protein EAHG_04592 [Escherichia coli B671]
MWDGWFRLQDMVEAGDEVSLSGDLIKRQPRRGFTMLDSFNKFSANQKIDFLHS